MKSEEPTAYYLPRPDSPGSRTAFEATSATAGPWSSTAQHGGPPAALLGRALEVLEPDLGRVLTRFSMDLLGPVPVGRVSVEARVLRAGRSVSLREAVLYDDDADRPVAVGRAWAFPRPDPLPRRLPALSHGPADGREVEVPPSWSPGYLDSIEWRWIKGSIGEPGPAVVWMRPRIPLLSGEEMSPWQRLLCCVDSASGASARLDPAEWGFLNTELTVHLVRPPRGGWICLDAVTDLHGGRDGGVGLATAALYDTDVATPLGRSAQSLLVQRRS